LARLRKKTIRWERPAISAPQKYRIYWAAGENVGYDSEHVDLGDVEEAMLPDAIPSLPANARQVYLGISAVNESGNESDITTLRDCLDFSIPEAPKDLQVLDWGVNTAPDYKYLGKLAMACVAIILLTGMGVLSLLRFGDRALDYFDRKTEGSRKEGHALNIDGAQRERAQRSSAYGTERTSDSSIIEGPKEHGWLDTDTPGLEVDAIIWSNDPANSFALINGKKVRLGESVGDFLITEIGRDYVNFQADASRFRVTMR